MSKLEYQAATAEVTNRPVGIGRPLRISEQGSDQAQGYSFIQQPWEQLVGRGWAGPVRLTQTGVGVGAPSPGASTAQTGC